MTQKHDSLYSWQNHYKNQNKYPATNSETTNPFIHCSSIRCDEAFLYFYFIFIMKFISTCGEVSMWINFNFTESISGPLKYGFFKKLIHYKFAPLVSWPFPVIKIRWVQ